MTTIIPELGTWEQEDSDFEGSYMISRKYIESGCFKKEPPKKTVLWALIVYDGYINMLKF